ncbi:MAG: DeoR/GlpR family DNA-binding transcription regulator [Rhodospirillales bacterium]
MPLAFRQQEIVDMARAKGRVLVEELAERFGLSLQTVRRDLNELCDQGLLARVHGGAVLATGTQNLAYEARRALAAAEKEAIGQACAARIPNNASLFINIGTTTEAVARALTQHQGLLVITNNMNVASILMANSGCEVIVAGGLLRRSDGALVGEATADFVKQFKVDIAVIGASAIDEEGALLDYDYREVRVAQALLENARQAFLVADSSKLTRSAPVRIAHIGQLSAFFTDSLTSPRLGNICNELGVELHQGTPLSTQGGEA